MERNPLTARRAWLGIAAGVLAYEVVCPEGELLSEGVDRALEKHRLATLMAIGVTALHLANLLPEQIDPFHRGLQVLKGAPRN